MGILEDSRDVLKETLVNLKSGTITDWEKSMKRLQDLNSSFPATKEFLEKRGLKNISELDELGRKELMDHLLGVYSKIKNKPTN